MYYLLASVHMTTGQANSVILKEALGPPKVIKLVGWLDLTTNKLSEFSL